jgi:probable DNA metabolism protein
MLILTYDGSFDGLLTVIYECYYQKLKPYDVQVEGEKEKDFLSQYLFIETENNKADKVYRSIEEKISSTALKNCYYAFLSDEDTKNMAIYRYIRLGFKQGKDVDSLLTTKTVADLHDLARKVTRERHRMLGLTRFSELVGGILYGKIQPKYNIISLIAPHFAKRLGAEKWMIHDAGRNLLVVGNQGKWLMREYKMEEEIMLHEREEFFRTLWKEFHQSIAIKDRKNPKLQQQFMPKRYWENLTEMK